MYADFIIDMFHAMMFNGNTRLFIYFVLFNTLDNSFLGFTRVKIALGGGNHLQEKLKLASMG